MKNKIELKPCPFCGSKNTKVLEYGNWKNYYCECQDCKALAPNPSSTDYSEEEAIAAWNTRNIDNFGKFMNEPKERRDDRRAT